ncbi:MAG: DUF4197 family protein [Erythrobacter sp.]
MTGISNHKASRRAILAGGAAAWAMLLLPGCAGGGGSTELGGLGGLGAVGGFSLADAVRRLLIRSSDNAFARLKEPGEFWDEKMAQLDLAKKTGSGANVVSRMLTSGPFKADLEHQFGRLAAEASARAEPLIKPRVRNISITDATAMMRRRQGAATRFLRRAMGDELLDVITPAMKSGLREAEDPVLGRLIAPLTRIDIDELASQLAREIEETIWDEIAIEETEIRANPQATRDVLLIRAFGS